ncbi:Invasion associated locus B (IalB) protein [Aquimixticola soesokkakensis]|uniref:Invasion associated locus B (IalB) protein n=1 Tax=Aquimixticola soesokkakensis TaxID=1519096 RepID=A0A1Y5SK70_9RHOB|nr:invasion associated locus B family protein [Aquimixticola soesokkakensis]SLN39574.1 Invasion associated locus B (IalB) protein [Aquimixticola soesokkakensis]
MTQITGRLSGRTASLALATVLGLGFAPLAFAQDTAAQDAAAQDTAPQADATQESAPQESTPAPAETASDAATAQTSDSSDSNVMPDGSRLVSTHGDWQLRCREVDSGLDSCNIYQLLQDDKGNNVAEITLFQLPSSEGGAEAGATVIAPLGTLLTVPLTLAVDNGEAMRYPYAFCTEMGCFSRIGLTPEEIAGFKAGKQATITVVPVAAADQPVALNLSLSGFTAAYAASIEANKPLADANAQ